MLDPDVVVDAGGGKQIRGARNWAKGAVQFGHMAAGVQLALVDGSVGLVLAPRGHVTRALRFTVDGGVVVTVEIILDPAQLATLEVVLD